MPESVGSWSLEYSSRGGKFCTFASASPKKSCWPEPSLDGHVSTPLWPHCAAPQGSFVQAVSRLTWYSEP